jgi:hypothetical protein
MAFSAAEVRTAPSGHIYVAALGALEPTDATSPLDAAYAELGYTTPEGVTITPNVEQEDIMVWQSLLPVLSPITGMTLDISFTMAQLNSDTLSLYFLGEEFTDDGTTARLDINSNPGTQERALVVEWEDNQEDAYRLVVPRAQMTNREELSLTRGTSVNLGLAFKALDDDGIAGYLLTNNSNLVETS